MEEDEVLLYTPPTHINPDDTDPVPELEGDSDEETDEGERTSAKKIRQDKRRLAHKTMVALFVSMSDIIAMKLIDAHNAKTAVESRQARCLCRVFDM